MTKLEMWTDGIANTLVCLLCLITTSILINSWRSIKGESFPRWTLVAIGLLYLDFAIKRMLQVFALGYPIYSVLVVWDVLSIASTAIGMSGHIAKVRWVNDKLSKYREDILRERAIIEEMKIHEINRETQIKLLETKLVLLSDNHKSEQHSMGMA